MLRLKDAFFYNSARVFALLYVVVKVLTGRNIAGLGFLLRQCKLPRYINFLGEKLYFDPVIASNYGLHIIGFKHEPESHKFLNDLLDDLHGIKSYFIEVGANIGVFLVDLARRDNVHVFGFEPSKNCVGAVIKTMQANDRSNFNVFANLVGDSQKLIPFVEGDNVQEASVFTSQDSQHFVMQVTIDTVEELKSIDVSKPTILMIDVEGYEPEVMRGASQFINCNLPLIIFEYNYVSKRHFRSADIRNILGWRYDLFRIRKDGLIDTHIENAWNCVAIPRNTHFESILISRLVI